MAFFDKDKADKACSELHEENPYIGYDTMEIEVE
jgi:hypothetical protein